LGFLLDAAVKQRASDLHVSVGFPPALRVRGRLGPIEGAPPLAAEDVRALLESSLNPRQMEKYEFDKEIDFSHHHRIGDGEWAYFRGCAFYERGQMAVAFRRITQHIPSLEELKLPPVLKKICQKRKGLFLVTGTTRTGKSSTLAALVNEMNMTRRDHIITIEDPVEYIHRSQKCMIHQREIGRDADSFAEAARSALRQDPDVLCIGELRDLETIAVAITAAETGHFVLGTLHTLNAALSIDRLIDVFPHEQQGQVRFQLASSLIGICSQQLIPGNNGQLLCAVEILVATDAVRACVQEGKTFLLRDLIQTGQSEGMLTMEQALARFVKNEVLSWKTAMDYTYEPQELNYLLQKPASPPEQA
jgi:twitching motility protein PilT